MTNSQRVVYAGVDTHQDVHVAAVLDDVGRLIDTASFGTDRAGLASLRRWVCAHGVVARVGVEGTGSYGAGLARCLNAAGITVVEVNRPNRQLRRRRGKCDTVDAEAAARAALAESGVVTPKSRDGIVEAIRSLKVVLDGTRKQQTQIVERLHHLVVAAPQPVRDELMALSSPARIRLCARWRPGADLTDPATATRYCLRILARQHQQLTGDHRELLSQLHALTQQANPALCAAYGIGPDTAATLLVAAGDNPERLTNEAAFAMLCGAAPIPASSGKTTAMRLNRGGNRQANAALHRIVLVRMSHNHPRTRHYVHDHEHSMTKTAIMRCLKRYVAREVYHLLVNPPPQPRVDDLRQLRRQAGLSQRQVGQQIGAPPTLISRIEHGAASHHTATIAAYRQLINALLNTT